MDALAERHHSVISSVLLGALCGSGVLPFRKAMFESVIKKSGIAVATNLAACEDACRLAETGDSSSAAQSTAPQLSEVPIQARSPKLQPLLDRVRRLAVPLQALTLEGTRRAIDYQDPAYAGLYLDRVERIAAIEAASRSNGGALTAANRPSLPLWTTISVTLQDLPFKTHSTPFPPGREEERPQARSLVG